MYKLYYLPGACSLSVHIVLEWLGVRYEAIRVNPADPAYREMNPAAQVPALDIGGPQLLTQCAAVLRYLARVHPAAELDHNTSPEAEAELERWSAFLTGDLHPAFFPVFAPQRYTTATDEAAKEHVKRAGLSLVRQKLDLLEAHLATRTHVVGSKRTIIDAYTVPMVRWASSMLPDALADYPAVRSHHGGLLADPGVRAALRQEGLVAD
jgi:glutathione S-transferase